MENTYPKCDNCGCTQFTTLEVNKSKPEYIPASEYFRREPQPYSYGIPHTSDFAAICDGCGAKYYYSRTYYS